MKQKRVAQGLRVVAELLKERLSLLWIIVKVRVALAGAFLRLERALIEGQVG